MISEDMQLRLLSDDPICVGNVPIRSVSYKAIAKIGYSKYYHVLSILTMSESDIRGQFQDPRISNPIGVVWAACQIDPSFAELFGLVCEMVFGCRPEPVKDSSRILFGEFELNENNISEVVQIIKLRNGMRGANDECGDNPADEATRQLIERRNALRKKVAARKHSDENSVSFTDIISIYASLAGIPLQEVLNYDVYQLIDQFKRKQMYEQYRTQIESMVHGAKLEDKDFKHYIRKISDKSEDD